MCAQATFKHRIKPPIIRTCNKVEQVGKNGKASLKKGVLQERHARIKIKSNPTVQAYTQLPLSNMQTAYRRQADEMQDRHIPTVAMEPTLDPGPKASTRAVLVRSQIVNSMSFLGKAAKRQQFRLLTYSRIYRVMGKGVGSWSLSP